MDAHLVTWRAETKVQVFWLSPLHFSGHFKRNFKPGENRGYFKMYISSIISKYLFFYLLFNYHTKESVSLYFRLLYTSLYFSYICSPLPSIFPPLSCPSLFSPQIVAFLLLYHIHVCMGFFFCCWDKICWQKQLKGARLYFICREIQSQWWRKHGTRQDPGGWLVTL